MKKLPEITFLCLLKFYKISVFFLPIWRTKYNFFKFQLQINALANLECSFSMFLIILSFSMLDKNIKQNFSMWFYVEWQSMRKLNTHTINTWTKSLGDPLWKVLELLFFLLLRLNFQVYRLSCFIHAKLSRQQPQARNKNA